MLGGFATHNGENCTMIAASGGLVHIRAGLTLHARSDTAVSAATLMLALACCQADTTAAFVAASGVPALLNAMALHDDADIVYSLCLALHAMTGNGAAHSIAAAGFVPALVAALHRHSGRDDLARRACDVLALLFLDDPASMSAAVAVGGVLTLVSGLASTERAPRCCLWLKIQ